MTDLSVGAYTSRYPERDRVVEVLPLAVETCCVPSRSGPEPKGAKAVGK